MAFAQYILATWKANIFEDKVFFLRWCPPPTCLRHQVGRGWQCPAQAGRGVAWRAVWWWRASVDSGYLDSKSQRHLPLTVMSGKTLNNLWISVRPSVKWGNNKISLTVDAYIKHLGHCREQCWPLPPALLWESPHPHPVTAAATALAATVSGPFT